MSVFCLFVFLQQKPTDNKTLIAILASCGALLIMIVILAVCASHHRKPYSENQVGDATPRTLHHRPLPLQHLIDYIIGVFQELRTELVTLCHSKNKLSNRIPSVPTQGKLDANWMWTCQVALSKFLFSLPPATLDRGAAHSGKRLP